MEKNKQLFEKQANSYKPIYPLVRLEDIIETISDKSIQWILNNYNHIYVEYSESVAVTRNKVPQLLRRTGIWISYNAGTEVITEYYKGDNKDVTNFIKWTSDDNWERFDKIKHLDGSITYQHLSESLKQLIGQGNNITNFPDDEDLEVKDGLLKFKDRDFEPNNFSGLGRVILRKNIKTVDGQPKNILYQDMFTQSNTIYEIRYNFDLNGAEITIPEGCVLDFQGGSFSNGVIVGNDTIIQSKIIKIFNIDIEFKGSWNINKTYPEWFGVVEDDTIDNTNILQKAINLTNHIVDLNNKKYLIGQVRTKSNITIRNGEIKIFNNWPRCFIMTGNNVAVDNIRFKGTISNIRALLCIHELYNGIISNCIFDTEANISDVFAIYCSTKAHNININNCIFGNLSYGILFDDMQPNYRVFDEITYSESIGENISILDCIFLNRTLPGDCIEINTPHKGFRKATVERCIFNNTVKGHNSGISIGFAKVDEISVTNCQILNSEEDGIHLEDESNNAYISNNYIYNCYRGINIGSGYNTVIKDNTISNCKESICIFTEKPANGYKIVGNNIYNPIKHPIILQHIINSFLSNNIIYSNLHNEGYKIITIQETSINGETKSAESNTISDNIVNITDGLDSMFISMPLDGKCFNNIFKNNKCSGKSIQNLITEGAYANYNRIEEHYGDTSLGKIVYSHRNLINSAVGRFGDIAINFEDGMFLNCLSGANWIPYGHINKGNSRPTLSEKINCYIFFDTTLNKPIWWTGEKWVDATGADV